MNQITLTESGGFIGRTRKSSRSIENIDPQIISELLIKSSDIKVESKQNKQERDQFSLTLEVDKDGECRYLDVEATNFSSETEQFIDSLRSELKYQ